MSVTKLLLIGESIMKIIFNDLISDSSIMSSHNFHESKELEIIWVAKRFITKSTDSYTFSKNSILSGTPEMCGPLIIVRRGGERGMSHLYEAAFVEGETLCPLEWLTAIRLSAEQF